MLSVVELALNNSVHASTGFTSFYLNGLTHPCVPVTLPLRGSWFVEGEFAVRLADISLTNVHKQVSWFLSM